MDYVLGSILTFKCIFLLWFHLTIFYMDSTYDTWWEKKMDLKKIQQKFQPTNNCGLLNDQIWTLFS